MHVNRISSVNLALSGETMTFIRYTPTGFCFNGWDSRRHSNIRDEVHIILSGRCKLDMEGESFELQAGNAFVVRRGKYHAPYDVTDDIERCSFMLDTVEGGFLDSQLKQLGGRVLTMPDDIGALCHALETETRQALPYYADMLQSRLTALMVELLRQADPGDVPNTVASQRTAKQSLLVGIDNFFSPWPNALGTEADLARQLNISRHKLNRMVWQYYGMSFREKLHLAKMDYASWLLRSTDYPCHQIATLCGYSADTSFYRAFSAHFGLPPQTFRKEQREKGIKQPVDLTDK